MALADGHRRRGRLWLSELATAGMQTAPLLLLLVMLMPLLLLQRSVRGASDVPPFCKLDSSAVCFGAYHEIAAVDGSSESDSALQGALATPEFPSNVTDYVYGDNLLRRAANGSQVSIDEELENVAPTAGDLNGDGLADLILGVKQGYLLVFFNEGTTSTPVWVEQTDAFAITNLAFEPDATLIPVLVDLTGDGLLDLAVSQEGDVQLFENTGNSTHHRFAASSADPFIGIDLFGRAGDDAYNFIDLVWPSFCDYDLDGDMDMVVGNLYGRIFVFRNAGTTKKAVFENDARDVQLAWIDVGLLASATWAPLRSDPKANATCDIAIGRRGGQIVFVESRLDEAVRTSLDGRAEEHQDAFQTYYYYTYADDDAAEAPGNLTADNLTFDEALGWDNPFFALQFSKTGANRPTLVDVTGDGLLDLLMGDGSNLYLINNTGTALWPQFGPTKAEVLDSSNTRDGGLSEVFVDRAAVPTLADLNADGLLDLVEGTQSGKLVLWWNNGSVADGPDYVLAQSSDNRSSEWNPFNEIRVLADAAPKFVDVDNDTDLDLLVGLATGSFMYFENIGAPNSPAFVDRTGSALYDPLRSIDLGSDSTVTRVTIDLADFTGDGVLDALVGDGDSQVRYYVNHGNASLISTWDFREEAGSASPFDGIAFGRARAIVQAVDLDADTDLDIVAFGGSGVSYLEHGGTKYDLSVSLQVGTANPFSTVSPSDWITGTLDHLIGDDDELDAIFMNLATLEGQVYQGATVINEAFEERRGEGNPLDPVVDMVFRPLPCAVDFDGNGFYDILIGSDSGYAYLYYNEAPRSPESTGVDAVTVFRNRTDNPFSGCTSTGFSDASFTCADMNNDTLIDCVAGVDTPDLIYIEQTVAGIFSCQSLTISDEDMEIRPAPELADLDGDGDQDLIVGTLSGEVAYFENTDGYVTFSKLTNAKNPFNGIQFNAAVFPRVIDVDEDGDWDVVLGTAPSGALELVVNDGNRTAPSFRASSADENPFSAINTGSDAIPAIVDVDDDGDEDIIVGDSSAILRVFYNSFCTPATTCGGTRGLCPTNELTEPICSCLTGFASSQCEECSDGFHGFNCDVCPGGGTKLQMDFPNICGERGACRDGATGTGICRCSDYFNGTTCEAGECPAGQGYLRDNGTALFECVDCPIGFAKTGSGNIECSACDGANGLTTVGAGSVMCDQCFKDYYWDLTSAGAAKCFECPQGAVCAAGTNLATLELKKAKWRVNPQSSVIEDCPGAGLSCTGGVNLTDVCASGHTGPLCNVCEDGWYQNPGNVGCGDCADNPISAPAVALLAIVLMFVLATVWKKIKSSSADSAEVQDKAEVRLREAAFYSSLRIKVKILLSYFQVVGSFPSAGLTFPALFTGTMSYFRFVNMGIVEIIPMDCMFDSDYYDAVLVQTLLPIAFSVALGIVALYVGWRYPDTRETNYALLAQIFFTVTYVVFPGTSLTLLAVFQCHELDDGTSYLIADYSMSCESDRYKSLVAYTIFMLFVYPIGVPLMYFVCLYRLRFRLNPIPEDPDMSLKVRRKDRIVRPVEFLIEPYETHAWWWEVVECFRRLTLTGLLIFMFPGTPFQDICAIIISLMCMKLYSYWVPYMDDEDDLLMETTQWQIFFTAFIGLVIRSGVTDDDPSTQLIMGILVLVVTATAILLTLVLIAITTKLDWEELQEHKQDRLLIYQKKEPSDKDNGDPADFTAEQMADLAAMATESMGPGANDTSNCTTPDSEDGSPALMVAPHVVAQSQSSPSPPIMRRHSSMSRRRTRFNPEVARAQAKANPRYEKHRKKKVTRSRVRPMLSPIAKSERPKLAAIAPEESSNSTNPPPDADETAEAQPEGQPGMENTTAPEVEMLRRRGSMEGHDMEVSSAEADGDAAQTMAVTDAVGESHTNHDNSAVL